MHGLFTYNCGAHAILKTLRVRQPREFEGSLGTFRCAGQGWDLLETQMWKTGTFEGEFEEVRFVTLVNGKTVLSNGRALAKPVGQGEQDLNSYTVE
jgi:peroxisomal enoyl-CoA hydratase 2